MHKEIIPDTEVLSHDFQDITENISAEPEKKTEEISEKKNIISKFSTLEIILIIAVCILSGILTCLLLF